MAKKADVKVEKDADTTGEALEKDNKSGTVAVGETVTFFVTTTIPEFADNYTNPVFKVTDVLSTGLELDTNSIKVYEGTYKTIAEVTAATTNNTLKTYTATEYEVSPAATTSGYTVNFKTDYIKGLTANQAVTISYKAKVTSDAAKSVNEEDNTVTVNYSNNPSDTTGLGIAKDKTNHYTFDIDGDLWGEQPYKATEVVKVGVDENGNEITETITLDNGKTVGALQGAEFKLYTDAACTQEYTTTDTKYTSPIVTDAQGRMTIKGLDAGTYYIKETKAPDGYIMDPNPHTIVIDATIESVEVTELYDTSAKAFVTTANENTIEVKYSVPTLKSYKVTIDGTETASYTIQTDATSTKILSQSAGDTVVGTDNNSGKIKNTKGLELPSTGGVGTTMMYMFGAIFVMFAGVLLVSKRRMSVR
jgi:fimbrial isopeptide formation D2 family protein/LPXTG-motif cell wall-anchored protein